MYDDIVVMMGDRQTAQSNAGGRRLFPFYAAALRGYGNRAVILPPAAVGAVQCGSQFLFVKG